MAVNIRPPTDDEINIVVGMMQAMSSESPRYKDKIFSAGKSGNLVRHFMNTGGGFIAEQDGELIGMIGGFVVDSMTHDYKYAADIGVYVKPEHRGSSTAIRLIKAWEDWAWAQGADEINLGISTQIDAAKTVYIYERLGYTMSSQGMVKGKKDV